VIIIRNRVQCPAFCNSQKHTVLLKLMGVHRYVFGTHEDSEKRVFINARLPENLLVKRKFISTRADTVYAHGLY